MMRRSAGRGLARGLRRARGGAQAGTAWAARWSSGDDGSSASDKGRGGEVMKWESRDLVADAGRALGNPMDGALATKFDLLTDFALLIVRCAARPAPAPRVGCGPLTRPSPRRLRSRTNG